MNLIGLCPVRNEGWVAGLSLRVALLYCDSIVVLNHASTDNTGTILAELAADMPDRVSVIDEADPEWNEMAHRQRMLHRARTMGATHLAIVDGDEILSGNVLPHIRKHVMEARPARILHLPIYNCRGSATRYHATGIWGNRVVSVAFADLPELSWQGDQFHHREPFGIRWQAYQPVSQGNGGIMHLWGASECRLIAKHALYKIVERLRWPAKATVEIDHSYSLAIKESVSIPFGAWTFRDVPESWWAPYQSLMQYLDLSVEPWQIAECRRLVAQHGRHRFAGLDLFGIA